MASSAFLFIGLHAALGLLVRVDSGPDRSVLHGECGRVHGAVGAVWGNDERRHEWAQRRDQKRRAQATARI
ncbi:uncharacterized protein METZ01_LOCUS9009 [marine metagenome]|uniref:Uncharacterized protein n=1 Tax=marine metagenome TaxID=408172 RepID=A0A381NNH8_9ZZZZ